MMEALEAPAGLTEIDKRRVDTAIRFGSIRRKRDTPARILVVEDTPDIRKLMRFMLETSGIQVTAIGDGQAAAEMIDNWPAPDLIVMDRMLPFVSGDELIRRVRADPVWGKVPIVVVSAKVRGKDVADSYADGADDYITKPFNPKHFIEVIGRYL